MDELHDDSISLVTNAKSQQMVMSETRQLMKFYIDITLGKKCRMKILSINLSGFIIIPRVCRTNAANVKGKDFALPKKKKKKRERPSPYIRIEDRRIYWLKCSININSKIDVV